MKSLFILSVSFILLCCYEPMSVEYIEPVWLLKQKEKVREKLGEELSSVLLAYTLGGHNKLPKKVVRSHRKLYLIHLFTPSGIHLSALFFFLSLFRRKFFFWPALILNLLPFLLEGFWAIKRVSLLRILYLLFNKLTLKPSPFVTFLLAFSLDFLLGTFDQCPLSYIYSFLFLGMIFAASGRPFFWTLIYLMMGQVLICFFEDIPLYPMNFILGFFFTSLFSLLFPFFLLAVWVPILCGWVKYPLLLFIKLVSMVSIDFPAISISGEVLILVFLLNLKRGKFIFIIFAIFFSPILSNGIKTRMEKNFYLAEERKGIKKITQTTRGYKIEYEEGYICHYRISNLGMEKNCQ